LGYQPLALSLICGFGRLFCFREGRFLADSVEKVGF